MENIEVAWIPGNRKHPLAEVQGYLFERNKAIVAGVSYRCLQYKSCPSKLHVLVGGSVQFGEHNHAPTPEKIQAMKIVAMGKEAAKSARASSTSQILQMMEAEANNNNLDAAYLGNTSNLKRRLIDTRFKTFGFQDLGNSFATLQIPIELQQTLQNQRFLLYDNKKSSDRIIIYASDESLDKLSYCDTWLLDGTFKSCPGLFYQLYTFHGVYNNSVAIPFVYAYLPGKSAEIYEELFGYVRSKTVNEPTTIITDFEQGAISAGKNIFIATELNGCLFHLTQSIFRRVQQDHDVYRRYRSTDPDGAKVKIAIRSLGALAFLRPQEVVNGFLELRAQFPLTDPVRSIFTYFQDNYIGQDWADVRFPIKFWNVYERFHNAVPRTNNSKEGWHYRFNSLQNRVHPSMASSLQAIQKEENHWRQECQKIRSGVVHGRKRKYIQVDKRLRSIMQGYDAQLYHGYLDFLHSVQQCLHDFICES